VSDAGGYGILAYMVELLLRISDRVRLRMRTDRIFDGPSIPERGVQAADGSVDHAS